MYQIENIDYDKAMLEFRRRRYKAVIFFLYEDDEKALEYPSELAKQFDNINNTTADTIAFITKYSNYKHVTRNRIPDEELGNARTCKLTNLQGIPNVFNLTSSNISMRTIAKGFNLGIENQLPCFVILNPNMPEPVVVKKVVNDNSSIFIQAFSIISEIFDVDYDIQLFAKKYKHPFYHLTAFDLLERNFNSIKYGISVTELKETIQNEKLEDYFNLEEIDNLSENGYIATNTFFENLYKIKRKDIDKELDRSSFISLLDKHVSFYSNKHHKESMLFKEIKEYIELSSIDYLATAATFKKGIRKELEISPSMVAICLGKVVEDELNLGIFNVFRGAFSISLPENYNKVQTGLDELSVVFNQCKNTICFNKGKRSNIYQLEYPRTSDLRKIAFKKGCLPSDKSNALKAFNAVNDLKDLKRKMGITDGWENIIFPLEVIAETRNDAIHKSEPLSRDDLKKSIDAFKNLIKVHFFEVNNELKKIVRN